MYHIYTNNGLTISIARFDDILNFQYRIHPQIVGLATFCYEVQTGSNWPTVQCLVQLDFPEEAELGW